VLLGVGLTVSWLEVYVFEAYDPKFRDDRGIAFRLGVYLSTGYVLFGRLGYLLAWVLLQRADRTSSHRRAMVLGMISAPVPSSLQWPAGPLFDEAGGLLSRFTQSDAAFLGVIAAQLAVLGHVSGLIVLAAAHALSAGGRRPPRPAGAAGRAAGPGGSDVRR
jgi:hypothetical protein